MAKKLVKRLDIFQWVFLICFTCGTVCWLIEIATK